MRNLGLVAVLTGGALGYYSLFYDNEVCLGEVLEDLRNDRIERLEIVSTRLFGQNKVFAQFIMTDDNTKRLVLGNVNEFIARIE